MKNDKQSVLTLAIESAILGGSLSLLSGEQELDFWTGEDKVSRAEELLPNIIRILERQKIDLKMIGRVAVSLGPGSFTGIRIGIATAHGLKDSLNIPCVGVSSLEAMAASVATVERVIAALPIGRDFICTQVFEFRANGTPYAVSEPSVRKSILDDSPPAVVTLESIRETITASRHDADVASVDSNLARHIGIAATRGLGSEALEPLFVQPV